MSKNEKNLDCWKLALAEKSLVDCVPVELREKFQDASREFLVDDSTPERFLETKRPGKWAIESEADFYIGLGSKSYFESDDEHQYAKKLSAKGISIRQNFQRLTRQRYLETLFEGKVEKIKNVGFLKKKSELVTYQLLKNGLTAGFYKRRVLSCFVHSEPYEWM